MNKFTVLYCDQCGFISDPNVGIKNSCPDGCGKLKFVGGSFIEILEWYVKEKENSNSAVGKLEG